MKPKTWSAISTNHAKATRPKIKPQPGRENFRLGGPGPKSGARLSLPTISTGAFLDSCDSILRPDYAITSVVALQICGRIAR
jgi:hypothetical protein